MRNQNKITKLSGWIGIGFMAFLPGLASAESVHANIVDTFVALSGGPHKGERVNHAEGIVAEGIFIPSPQASQLTMAPHMQKMPSDVVIRFSNATGVPQIHDASGEAFPKGMAIRFLLDDGDETDIVLLSVNRFPVSTPEKFLELLTAIKASRDSDASPSPIARFLENNPSAKRFVELEKPAPESFTTQSYHGLNAFIFTNSDGENVYGRYMVEPISGSQFLSKDARESADRNYLSTELESRLEQGKALMRISLQIANEQDIKNDPTVVWPEDRQIVELGVLEIENIMENGAEYAKNTMFNPLALTDGISASDDPVLLARPGAYALSFQKRAD
jgi:catalase